MYGRPPGGAARPAVETLLRPIARRCNGPAAGAPSMFYEFGEVDQGQFFSSSSPPPVPHLAHVHRSRRSVSASTARPTACSAKASASRIERSGAYEVSCREAHCPDMYTQLVHASSVISIPANSSNDPPAKSRCTSHGQSSHASALAITRSAIDRVDSGARLARESASFAAATEIRVAKAFGSIDPFTRRATSSGAHPHRSETSAHISFNTSATMSPSPPPSLQLNSAVQAKGRACA